MYRVQILWEHIEQFIEDRIKNLLHCISTVEDDSILDQLEICDHIGFNQGLDYISKLLSKRIDTINLNTDHIQKCDAQNDRKDEVSDEKLKGLFEILRTTDVVRLETKFYVLAPLITNEWDRIVRKYFCFMHNEERNLKCNLKKIETSFREPQKRKWILDIDRKFHLFINKQPSTW